VSLFDALSVSASGMSAQRTRAELLTENLANAETTRTPEGGPYRRKDAVFATDYGVSPFASVFEAQTGDGAGGGLAGVGVADITVDNREPERRYQPGHPDADAAGYVAFPRINPAEDMVDLMGAARGYEANVAAVAAVKDMIQHSIDLFH
jgi:flagellar basal-body rod protein FlgC